ncbi:MAG TPA: P-loop NTPase [Gammaproteobacteria bacterium]
MRKIVVLNTKGGCGKSTIATNLAAWHALHGRNTTIMDYDPQGSSMRWLTKRDETRPRINGVAAAERNSRMTRSWQLRVPMQTECLIVDTPAGLEPQRLTEITRNAHAVIVPVLPSDIDIHAASRCIADLLLIARIDRREERIAVVANRVKKNTRVYHALTRFLHSLDIPFVATLRDTQNYINCSEQGVGIHEMSDNRVIRDRRDWQPLLDWIGSRRTVPVQLVAGMTVTGGESA